MKFNNDKKTSIKMYILEKISQHTTSLSKAVAEASGVNQATVHSYLNEMIEEGIIRKVRRGQYDLVVTEYRYEMTREAGELDSDTYALDRYLSPLISKCPSNVQAIWNYAFSEMMNNVMDHSAASKCELLIWQDFMKTSVMICDNGVGIFKKIKDHFGFATLDEAICELFKGKLTTDMRNHSGEGIFFSSKIMDDFFIVSSGKIFTCNKYDSSRIISLTSSSQTGTCVIMELSNFSHKTVQEVFDAYASVEEGFFKTKIPLKNMFDAAPVSRSQAKRVCNRLEKFTEVDIDFDEVNWMGQGFAHQLFVVFAHEHPQIRLTPTNMNADVEKMYYHVIREEVSQ